MDTDIRENLKELGAHVRSIGNQIASTKSSQESITAMRDCLRDGARTLDVYLKIQRERYSDQPTKGETMPHPDYEGLVIDFSGDATQEQKDALNKVMDAWQEAMLEDQKNISSTLNVSLYTAGLVQYLRTRSRWTQEKEDELVRLDQAGEPLPNVLAGDF